MLPFLALGQGLMAAGYDVSILTNDGHGDLVRRAGVGFVSIAPPHPPQSRLSVHASFLRVAVPSFHQTIAHLRHAGGDGRLIGIVAHDLALGAFVAAELLDVTLVEVILSPLGLVDRRTLGQTSSRLAPRGWDQGLIGQLRAASGLSEDSCDVRAADLSLALFPQAFSPRALPVAFTGFPLRNDETALESELESFLSAGPPPIVATTGTGTANGRVLLEAVVGACQSLGLRAVLLSLQTDMSGLAAGGDVVASKFANLAKLLPCSRAIIHHGGIGTIAEAIRAGAPQVIAPRLFDQPSNAACVERLGLGRAILERSLDADSLIDALRRLDEDCLLLGRLQAARAEVTAASGVFAAIDRIEKVLAEDRLFARGPNDAR
jgi:rhamnosyltransferase subunit B